MSNQIIAIDLGSRSTKAVCVEKDGDTLRLVSYTIQDRPDQGKNLSRESLSKHLSAVAQALNTKTKEAVLIVGATESLLCHAEMPVIEVSQMRKMVKLNPKLYFQQELPNHSFDCFVLHQGADSKPANGKAIRKAKTLIVAIKDSLLKFLLSAAESAELDVQQVTTSQTGAANAFLNSSEAGQNKVVALVDIGFSNSTISVLVNGEITLTRTVNIGADKFTSGLAEAMNITYSVAEGLMQIMPDKVHSQLKTILSPLTNELSNSIHFFEQKEDKKIAEVYVSGGSARSKLIFTILQAELNLTCQSWDPIGSLKNNFTAAQMAALQQETPQLTVAVGAALSWFKPEFAKIDLLAMRKEEAELRSRDPMRRGYAIAASLIALMAIWYSVIFFRVSRTDKAASQLTEDLKKIQPQFSTADAQVKKMTEISGTLQELQRLSKNRFLWAPALNALQYTVVPNFEIVHLQISQQIIQTKGSPAATNANVVVPKQAGENIEQTIFTIQAKSSAKPSAAESFMKALEESAWFRDNLRSEEPIRLKESQAAQVDPNDTNKLSIRFTVECYAERKL
jgi:type IV pilus assembly protein PilM